MEVVCSFYYIFVSVSAEEGKKWPQYELYFGVKYYVSDPSSLREEMTRYYYCLQVCQDVRENRMLHSREVVMELLSLLIQASAGDYDPVDHPPGYTDEFMKFLYLNSESLVSCSTSSSTSKDVYAVSNQWVVTNVISVCSACVACGTHCVLYPTPCSLSTLS